MSAWVSIAKFMCVTLILTKTSAALDNANRRPIYVIAHMVNSIEEIPLFLKAGANALEIDVTFYSNGTLHQVFHGFPCDCGRECNHKTNVGSYLNQLRSLNNGPDGANLTILYFDLKLSNVDDKQAAGSSIARAIIEDLWGWPHEATSEEHLVKTVVTINHVINSAVVTGFLDTFNDLGLQRLLWMNVALDGGVDDLHMIGDMWSRLGVRRHLWQGDGVTNCLNFLHPDARLREALKLRDSADGNRTFAPVKVYSWTVDDPARIRASLSLGVDGFISNTPSRVLEVMGEEGFRDSVRLATTEDDPLEKFTYSG